MAADQNWFALTHAPRVVEVDLASIGTPLLWHEAELRVRFPVSRRHQDGFSYRSLRSVARFDCAAGHSEAIAISYFDGPAADGRELATETDVSEGGTRPLSPLVGKEAAGMLLKAVCALRRESRDVSGVCPYGGPRPEPAQLLSRNCNCTNGSD